MNKREQVERLELAGFALHKMVTALREGRERFPERDDLSPRLEAAEEQARMLSGEIAMRLRDLDEAARTPDHALEERLCRLREAHPVPALPLPPEGAPRPPPPWSDVERDEDASTP